MVMLHFLYEDTNQQISNYNLFEIIENFKLNNLIFIHL
jgi:hypothetical protein